MSSKSSTKSPAKSPAKSNSPDQSQASPGLPQPQIEFIALPAGVACDRPRELTVLVRITPPLLPLSQDRPALNLGLVLDRSGSMAGRKLTAAKQAAKFAIEQLLPSDRVSLTVFDHEVQTPIPSTLATHKPQLLSIIDSITPGGSTALHDGWLQGSLEVSQHLAPAQLNRVILLSDGQANQGETNTDVIASHVGGLSQRGVSTTTMGLGDDYGEDLLLAMANSGDGNFFHIESPQQLPDFFATELTGLMATVGRAVSLGIRGQNDCIVTELLNQLEQTPAGNWMLPNLISGAPVELLFRLRVPAQSGSSPDGSATHSPVLCSVRLAWQPAQQEAAGRQSLYQTLQLPIMTAAALDDLPPAEVVQQQVAILAAARGRNAAIAALDRGEVSAAADFLSESSAALDAAPYCPQMVTEQAELAELLGQLKAGKVQSMRKKALYQARSINFNLMRGDATLSDDEH